MSITDGEFQGLKPVARKDLNLETRKPGRILESGKQKSRKAGMQKYRRGGTRSPLDFDEFRGLKPSHGKIESGSQKARKESLNQESRNAGRDGRGSPLNLLGSKRLQCHAEHPRWPSGRPFFFFPDSNPLPSFPAFIAFLIQYLCSPILDSWFPDRFHPENKKCRTALAVRHFKVSQQSNKN